MSAIVLANKIFSTLWDHKKKAIFGAVCVGTSARYLRNRERDRQVFRGYCFQALKLGNENILATVIPRRITVLVRDTKAKTSFEKYALPLLNLAGLQVDVVLPQDPKQLTAIASVLTRKDADLVYVVGTDDTVTRVLSGLLQPSKMDEKRKESISTGRSETRLLPPIGVFFDDASYKLKSQCENAMAVIRGLVKDANVLQVKVKDSDPVCVLNAVHWGRFADAEQAVPRYWYWGPLKNRMAYFWNAFISGPPESIEATVRYIDPCPGCSKCYVAPVVQKRHWLWRLFIGNPRNEKSIPDYSKVVNEHCGEVHSAEFETVEVIARNHPYSAAPGFDFTYGPTEMGETQFIREGWARRKRGDPLRPTESISNTLHAREAEITFKTKTHDEKKPPSKLVVGGELTDLADFSVKTIPRAIQLVTVSPLSN